MLRIWGRTTSSNVQKLLWFCDEAGIAFERIDAGLSFGVTRTPAYLAMNPNALVPTIDDEGFILWESNAILRYLARKHRQLEWYPEDLKTRATIEQWMDWGSTALAASITPVVWGLFRTPPEQQQPEALRASAEKATHLVRLLDAHLRERDWMVGDRITLADIPVAIQTYRWLVMPWERIGYTRPDLPHAQAWFERLARRPAVQRVVMIGVS